jgi:hypothetical protein
MRRPRDSRFKAQHDSGGLGLKIDNEKVIKLGVVVLPGAHSNGQQSASVYRVLYGSRSKLVGRNDPFNAQSV